MLSPCYLVDLVRTEGWKDGRPDLIEVLHRTKNEVAKLHRIDFLGLELYSAENKKFEAFLKSFENLKKIFKRSRYHLNVELQNTAIRDKPKYKFQSRYSFSLFRGLGKGGGKGEII